MKLVLDDVPVVVHSGALHSDDCVGRLQQVLHVRVNKHWLIFRL